MSTGARYGSAQDDRRVCRSRDDWYAESDHGAAAITFELLCEKGGMLFGVSGLTVRQLGRCISEDDMTTAKRRDLRDWRNGGESRNAQARFRGESLCNDSKRVIAVK